MPYSKKVLAVFFVMYLLVPVFGYKLGTGSSVKSLQTLLPKQFLALRVVLTARQLGRKVKPLLSFTYIAAQPIIELTFSS